MLIDFDKENNIFGFSKDLGTAGQCWFCYLLKRLPKLSVKGATNLSLQHAATSFSELLNLPTSSISVWLSDEPDSKSTCSGDFDFTDVELSTCSGDFDFTDVELSTSSGDFDLAVKNP